MGKRLTFTGPCLSYLQSKIPTWIATSNDKALRKKAKTKIFQGFLRRFRLLPSGEYGEVTGEELEAVDDTKPLQEVDLTGLTADQIAEHGEKLKKLDMVSINKQF